MKKIVEENNLSFEINDNFTANVINSPKANGDIQIPRSITFNSHEYIITSIEKDSFKSNSNIKSISFPNDSEVQTIDTEAFIESSLNSLSIPPNFKEFRENWCRGVSKLTRINVSPQNKRFSLFDGQLLLSKTDKNSKNYDILLFALRNIEEIIIPSNITRIASSSISYCDSLKKIQFSSDSNLTSFGKHSFNYSSLESISIPSSVVIIDDSAFSYCSLQRINFPKNSKLESIGTNAFSATLIESIVIPAKVSTIHQFSFYGCPKLRKVDFQENSSLTYIYKSAFADSSLETISIPPSLSLIGECVFNCCINLRKIEFPPNSKLEIIESSAFEFSSIETILLPQSLTSLCESVFSSCNNLIGVEFLSENVSIQDECFYDCLNLLFVSFPNASKVEINESSFRGVSDDFLLLTKNFADVIII